MSAEVEQPLPGEWAELWRQDQPPPLGDLRRRVRRAGFLNRLALISEVSVGAAAAAAGVWLAYGGNWVVGAAAMVFGAFGLAVAVATRGRPVESDVDSVTAALDTAIRQAERQQRAAMAGLGVCAAALLFLAVTALGALDGSHDVEVLMRLVRLQAAAAVFVALALVLVTLTLRRAGRRLAHLRVIRERL